MNDLPALMAYGRNRRSVVIDSLEAGVLYSIRVQRVSRDGSVVDVPAASAASSFLMIAHIDTQANATAGESAAALSAALLSQQIDSAKQRFEQQIEDAHKAVCITFVMLSVLSTILYIKTFQYGKNF